MKKRYLLSTGQATSKAEEYIIDLFKIYLTVYPGDIPHYKNLGFDFLLTRVTKNDLISSVRSKIESLVKKIKDSVGDKHTIKISELDLIDEETVRLVIDVSGVKSDDILINLYPE